MGVHGLWRLIEPSGKPVPFETLENKVLAVDISLWLHQSVKGFQDSKGAPLPNAHLLGIYHRLCKLLYFRIKPVFVFDGGVPELKRQTIAKRKQLKAKSASRADEIQRELLQKILKHTAISKVLEDKLQLPEKSDIPRNKNAKDDMFVLADANSNLNLDSTLSSSEDDTSCTDGDSSSPSKYVDLHNVDLESQNFKSLPVDVRHEILTDLKETRKQSSWGKIHQIPKISHEFSSYQMQRLLKRQAVQAALEQAEKEMGGKTLSLAELESMLKDQGIITDDSLGKKIASDEHAKYLLVKANQRESESKKLQPIIDEINEDESSCSSDSKTKTDQTNRNKDCEDSENTTKNNADKEYENDIQKAIALSLMEEASTSKEAEGSKKSSFVENFTDADFMSSSSDEDFEETDKQTTEKKTLASAEHYMVEYSGLTPSEIAKILESKSSKLKTKFARYKSKELENVESDETSHNKFSKEDPEDDGKKDKQMTESGTVTEKETETSSDNVEVMSSSSEDSSDLIEVNSPGVNVIVNTDETFNEKDDLFSDIFESKEDGRMSHSSDSFKKADEFDFRVSKSTEKREELQITIKSNEKPEDYLFGEIFENHSENDQVSSTNEIASFEEPSVEESKLTVNNTREVELSKQDVTANDKHEVELSKNDSKPISLECLTENKSVGSTVDNNGSTVDNNSIKPSLAENIEMIDTLKKANKTESLTKQLTELKDKLQQETSDLMDEKGAKQRMAENITDQMYQEAQDLLELFGVPYIIAPMEAEAQCAFLDEIELTSGTITDDSDIWLFGGRTVYKNFFNQNKYVMEFRAENIEHHFKLSREQLILLALLVGSDYTNGLQGVGPVTALEILATFPPSKLKETDLTQFVSGLKEFRSWFTKGKSVGIGRTALKKKLKNITFTDNFPSVQVVQAYLDPKVETSDEMFSWGKPNFDVLIEYARDKFGWTKPKAEQILNPVLQRMQESRVQRSIKDYFSMKFKVTDSGQVQSLMSKRVKSAVTNLGKDPDQRLADEFAEEIAKEIKKKTVKRKTKNDNGEVESKRRRQKKVDESEVASNSLDNKVDTKNNKNDVHRADQTDKKKRANSKSKEEQSEDKKKSKRSRSNSEINNKSNTKNKSTKAPKKIDADKGQVVDDTPCTSKDHESEDHQDNKKSRKSDVSEKTKPNKKRISKEVDSNTNKKLSEGDIIPRKSTEEAEHESDNSEDEILDKIAQIRQRRETKLLKKQLETQSMKLDKQKFKDKKKDVVEVLEELKGDEDVDVLVQTALISESKVEQIYKEAQEDIIKLQATTSRVSSSQFNQKQVTNRSGPSIPNRAPRIPRKDVIPQKSQDQAMILRNKLRAIEVFRKGKKGPGYVPKTGKKKAAVKGKADLSESSNSD